MGKIGRGLLVEEGLRISGKRGSIGAVYGLIV